MADGDDHRSARASSQFLGSNTVADHSFNITSSRPSVSENGVKDAVVGNFSDTNAYTDDVCSDEELDDVDPRLWSSGTHLGQPQTPERDSKNDCHATRTRCNEWSYKEFLIDRRQHRAQSMASVIKTEYMNDPALCNLTEFDSDDNLDEYSLKETKRKREGRELRKTVSLQKMTEQQEKALSGDFSVMSISDPLDHSHLNGLVLDGSGRFSHLKLRPTTSPVQECQARRHISEPPKCPKDRDEFHSSFSLLINLGTEAKKDKEKKMSCYKRQMSEELEQWRTTIIEQIWLELRAYLGGTSPEEQFRVLKMERQNSEKVIDDINNFCFADTVLEEITDGPLSCGCKSNSTAVKGSNTSYRELVSRSVSASFIDLNLTDETVRLQEKALFQMQNLLNRLDHYESCYSTTEACMKDNAKFRNPDFQRRVKCLNLWLNITCDLCQKLKLFGRIIGAHSRGIQWPFVNFEFPKPHSQDFLTRQKDSIPSVMETEHTESSENEEEEEEQEDLVEEEEDDNDDASSDEAQQGDSRYFLSPNLKQVKFQCGDDSSGQSSTASTPVHHNLPAPVSSSTPVHFPPQASHPMTTVGASVLSLSRASSEVSLEDSRSVRSSIYRHYAEKCLRKMGLQKLNVRLRDLFHGSLSRAKEALERPKKTIYSDIGVQVDEEAIEHADICRTSSSASSEGNSHPQVARGSSLSEHGEWSSQFILMGLPSFRPTYLFIVRIQLDVIHECLKLRKDQRPIGDPSFLSIRQLIRECKEVLKGATLVKQYYHYMVAAVMWDEELEAESKFETDLTEFDEDMKSMLDVYFGYLQSWIYMLQALPEASLGMKSALEEEWTYTKSICAYVIGGEAEAGKKFSSLASSLLSSIGDFLENGIDDNTRSLYEVEDADYGAEDENEDEEYYNGDESDNIEDRKNFKRIVEMKQNVQGILRNFKNLFNEARERASKALGFAKLLRKDLEIAADFNITVTTQELFARLIDTHHVQVKVQLSAGYMMFIPESIVSNKQLILQLLNVTSGREDPAELSAKEDGYLLMVRCDSETDNPRGQSHWSGTVINVEPTAETAIALSHIEVMGLLFVVTHSGTLAQQRQYFETVMGRKVRLVNEQTSCHQSIAESLSELKTNAVDLMVKISQAIQQVNERLNLNNIILHEESILKLYRETMLKIYDFGFEYQRELMRLVSRDQREKMCHMTVSFAKDWMSFVIDKCERGRGTRPRWATQGLEFITIACEPKNIVYLTDEEFQDFQRRILDCLTHIIGSSDNRHIAPGLCLSRSSIDLPRSCQPSVHRLISCPEYPRFSRSNSSRSVQSEPSGHHTNSQTSTPSSTGNFFFGDSRGTRHSIPELPEISIMGSSEDGRLYLVDVSQARRGSRGLLTVHAGHLKFLDFY